MRVIRLDKKVCDEFVKRKHYSRKPSIFWAGFGLVIGDTIEGVIVYGQPSPPLQKYAFDSREFKFYELSRLVIQTEAKNAASFLIAESLKMLEKPCAVVSFADSAYNHCGIVYQATNWLYTGSTLSHDKLYVIDGVKTHPMTLCNKGITDPTRWAKENGIETVKPAPKHRYFFFVGSKTDKKRMAAKLKYSVVSEYPKTDKRKYDDGERLTFHVRPA